MSQDHGEIYINIAEYGAAYEQYLGLHHTNGSSASPPSQVGSSPGGAATGAHDGFLKMNCFGPWRIDDRADRKYICKALLALSLYLAKPV